MIILDNTVLTSLSYMDLLSIPSILFGESSIPKSVFKEGTTGSDDNIRVKRIKTAIKKGRIEVITITKEEKGLSEKYRKTLGPGESSCLSLAVNRGCLFGTDDLKARKLAKKKNVDVIGTLGILRLAYRKGILDEDELTNKVTNLHEILYFTKELEDWVLSTLE